MKPVIVYACEHKYILWGGGGGETGIADICSFEIDMIGSGTRVVCVCVGGGGGGVLAETVRKPSEGHKEKRNKHLTV